MAYDSNIQLALIAVIASAFATMGWIIRYALKEVKGSLDKHVKAAGKIAKATDNNTRATKENAQVIKELKDFMINLNGKLTDITKQTVKEQQVKEQTVQHQTVKND